MRFPFGRYGPKHFPPNGVDVCFVNSGYLKWFVNDERIFMDKRNEKIIVACQNELRLRDQDNSHFYQDKIIQK